MTKHCTTCQADKNMSEFCTKYSVCKSCKTAYDRNRYEKQRTIILSKNKAYREVNREKLQAYEQADYLKNKDSHLARCKTYRAKNPERNAQRSSEYYQKHTKGKRTEKHRAYQRLYLQKRRLDPAFRIAHNLRSRVRYAIVGKSIKCATTFQLLGCSLEQLKQYLASKFTEGMTFDNYGSWHIDHIIPCASFDLTKEAAQKQCFHYTNLQPLWAADNWKKSATICG